MELTVKKRYNFLLHVRAVGLYTHSRLVLCMPASTTRKLSCAFLRVRNCGLNYEAVVSCMELVTLFKNYPFRTATPVVRSLRICVDEFTAMNSYRLLVIWR